MRFRDFDHAYVTRLVAGDPATARHFADYFGGLIRLTARRRLGGFAAVEPDDVEQETLLRVLRVLRSPEGIRRAESLGCLVSAVCRNVLREMRRAEARRRPPIEENVPRAGSEEPAENQLLRQERQRAVLEALSALSPAERHLVESLFFEEHEREDVARRIGVTRDYLRVLLQRAKARLRRALAEHPAVA